MKSLHKRQLSLAVTAALATTLTSGLAFGQDEDIDAVDETVEEVVVTGTRIKTEDGFGATSPVTVVNAENIKNLGFVNIEQVLNSLPSIETSQNANISNGSTGTATVDLRGLGTNRTLVLVNGRRMQAGGIYPTGRQAVAGGWSTRSMESRLLDCNRQQPVAIDCNRS